MLTLIDLWYIKVAYELLGYDTMQCKVFSVHSTCGSSKENVAATSWRRLRALLVSPRSQAKIARCGDGYDRQLVKRSS